MTDWLRSQGFQVDTAGSFAEAVDRLGRKAYDLLLVDVRLQDGDGLDLLEQVRRNYPQSQVVLITGYGDADAAVEALRAGALDYLTKPLIDDELLLSIERALERFNGNRKRAAEALNISTVTLWRKMKQYGLSPDGRSVPR